MQLAYSRCAHALPGQLQRIWYLVIPGGGVLANFVLHRVRQFCQPWSHPRAFGTHVHSYPNIYTKHGGFYWKHQQIQRLAYLLGTGKTFRGWLRYCLLNFLSAFLHCLTSWTWVGNLKIQPELTFFLVTKQQFCWSKICIKFSSDDLFLILLWSTYYLTNFLHCFM